MEILKNKQNSLPQQVDENMRNIEKLANDKQDTLVSGENIKTINNQSILGSGNLQIQDLTTEVEVDGNSITSDNVANIKSMQGNYNENTNKFATASDLTALGNTKQDTLNSGTNIKTINNQSILGSGNIDIQGGGGDDIELYSDDTIDLNNLDLGDKNIKIYNIAGGLHQPDFLITYLDPQNTQQEFTIENIANGGILIVRYVDVLPVWECYECVFIGNTGGDVRYRKTIYFRYILSSQYSSNVHKFTYNIINSDEYKYTSYKEAKLTINVSSGIDTKQYTFKVTSNFLSNYIVPEIYKYDDDPTLSLSQHLSNFCIFAGAYGGGALYTIPEAYCTETENGNTFEYKIYDLKIQPYQQSITFKVMDASAIPQMTQVTLSGTKDFTQLLFIFKQNDISSLDLWGMP